MQKVIDPELRPFCTLC